MSEDRLGEIESKLIGIVSKIKDIPKADIMPNHSFRDDLHYDSLDKVETEIDAEDEFEIEILDEDMEALTTIKKLAQYVLKKYELGTYKN